MLPELLLKTPLINWIVSLINNYFYMLLQCLFLVRSKEFQNRINQLAKTLNIVPYPDPLVTLQAVRKIVCTRLAPDCVEHPDKYITKVSYDNVKNIH